MVSLYTSLTGKPSTNPIYKKITKPTSPTQGFSSRTSGFSANTSIEKRSRGGRGRQVFRDIQAEKEIATINTLKNEITTSGGRTNIQNLKEVGTGNRIQTTNTYIDKIVNGVKFKQRVFEVKNLDTGEVTIKRFDYDKKSGRSYQSGGVKYKETKSIPKGEAKPLKEVVADMRKEMEKFVTTKNKVKVKEILKATNLLRILTNQTAKTVPIENYKYSPKKAKKLALDVAIMTGGELLGAGILLVRGARVAKVIITGTTKNINGVQVSNLRFKDLAKIGKTIGNAKVFSVLKGKNSFSVTIGSFTRGGKISNFIGIEGGKQINKALLRRELQSFISSNGEINVIQVIKKIKGVKIGGSLGSGEVAVISTKKVITFPTGKIKQLVKVNVNSYVNVAKSFTEKEWSFILGKTLTKQKDLSYFVALIKRLNNASQLSKLKFTSSQLKQYQKAIQKSAGVVSSALSKSKQINPKNVQNVPLAIKIIKSAINNKGSGTLSTKIKTIKIKVPTGTTASAITKKDIGKIKTITSGLTKLQATSILQTPKSKLGSKGRTIQREINLIKSKIKIIQKIIQKVKPTTITKSKQIPILKTKATTLTSQLKLIKTLTSIPSIINIPIKIFLPPIPFKMKVKRIPAKTLQRVQGYNVYVKSRGKWKKVNPLPLSKSDALNRGAYVVDHSTAVSYRINPLTRVKKKGKITSKERGAKKRIKDREYKIKNKKKINTPRRFIEKKGNPRINTKGEKRGLSASRVASQLNKKRKPNAKKKRKSK